MGALRGRTALRAGALPRVESRRRAFAAGWGSSERLRVDDGIVDSF
ncbi:MAG: hypothetical protein MZV70_02840 [Desulfobacterales bacterium]|nr:hypothetical protein [Desulfobacterales bacterium]